MKLIVLGALLTASISIVPMERVTKMSKEEATHWVGEKVTLLLQDENDNVIHAVELPLRHAQLIGALPTLLENSESDFKKAEFPLPLVTIQQWRLIEKQLERVYGIVNDFDHALQLRQEIVAEYGSLDSTTLINLICALNFIDMPILLEIASESLVNRDPKDISYDDVSSLPGDMANRLIVHNILSKIGALPEKEHAKGKDQVASVCLAGDGKHIVLGATDGTVRISDMEGNEVAVCRGHADAVLSVHIASNGKHIVSRSMDKTVRVWDMQGKAVAVCRSQGGSVISVTITPDGKHIVSGLEDGTLQIWDMEGNEVAVCRGHENPALSVCVTPDSKHIVSGSWDNTIQVWDLQGHEVAVCKGHEGPVASICITPDGKHIVSGSYDKTVRVWDMQGHEVVVCKGHENGVKSVCVTHNGKRIISGSYDTIRIWDMKGNEVAVCRGQGDVLPVCVTQDDKHIVSRFSDGTVRVWDMQGKAVAVCRDQGNMVCVATDGKLISGSSAGSIRVWDIGVLDRILCMGQEQAKALWDYLIKLPQEHNPQKCWEEIEAILEKVMDQNSNQKPG